MQGYKVIISAGFGILLASSAIRQPVGRITRACVGSCYMLHETDDDARPCLSTRQTQTRHTLARYQTDLLFGAFRAQNATRMLENTSRNEIICFDSVAAVAGACMEQYRQCKTVSKA